MFRRTLRPTTLKSLNQHFGVSPLALTKLQSRSFSRNLLAKNANKLNQTSARGVSIALQLPMEPQQQQPTTKKASSKSKSKAERGLEIRQRVLAKKAARLSLVTDALCEKFVSQDIDIKSVEIYVRSAGSFDDEQSQRQEVDIALRGIMHTVVILNTDSDRYLLDRVIEGIRLTSLNENPDKFKREEMLKVNEVSNVDISTADIADWIQYQGSFKYHVAFNNCVYFSAYFYQNFILGQNLMKNLKFGVQTFKNALSSNVLQQ